jgi:ribosomal protein S27AE
MASNLVRNSLSLKKETTSQSRQTREKNQEVKVSKAKEIHVRCMRCREWVPTSINFKDKKSFDLDGLVKNRPPCPRCGEMTSYNKENLCIRDESGDFVCIEM